MHRRRVTLAGAALFAIGVAFAAVPISKHAGREGLEMRQRMLWTPGTNMLMSAREASAPPLAPPQ